MMYSPSDISELVIKYDSSVCTSSNCTKGKIKNDIQYTISLPLALTQQSGFHPVFSKFLTNFLYQTQAVQQMWYIDCSDKLFTNDRGQLSFFKYLFNCFKHL